MLRDARIGQICLCGRMARRPSNLGLVATDEARGRERRGREPRA